MAKSIGKYVHGSATILNALANGVNGNAIPIIIIAVVRAITGLVAQLWINGILRVRIICIMSVWDSSPSINHPD
jgi:hypothetical protein